MLAHSSCIVAAHGQWDFNDGRSVEYIDLIDTSGGGTFRVAMSEGQQRPPVYSSGEAHLEFSSTGGDRPKVKVRLKAFQSTSSGQGAS